MPFSLDVSIRHEFMVIARVSKDVACKGISVQTMHLVCSHIPFVVNVDFGVQWV